MAITKAMARALQMGSAAPDTPDTDAPGIDIVDCRSEQTWIENVHFRTTMKSRAGKPKNRKGQTLDRYNPIRRRRDKRIVPACDRKPSTVTLMCRSGYYTKGD